MQRVAGLAHAIPGARLLAARLYPSQPFLLVHPPSVAVAARATLTSAPGYPSSVGGHARRAMILTQCCGKGTRRRALRGRRPPRRWKRLRQNSLRQLSRRKSSWTSRSSLSAPMRTTSLLRFCSRRKRVPSQLRRTLGWSSSLTMSCFSGCRCWRPTPMRRTMIGSPPPPRHMRLRNRLPRSSKKSRPPLVYRRSWTLSKWRSRPNRPRRFPGKSRPETVASTLKRLLPIVQSRTQRERHTRLNGWLPRSGHSCA